MIFDDIESRNIDGVIYLNSIDLINVLRRRVSELEGFAQSLGDPFPPENYTIGVACCGAIEALQQHADQLDLAIISYLSESDLR